MRVHTLSTIRMSMHVLGLLPEGVVGTGVLLFDLGVPAEGSLLVGVEGVLLSLLLLLFTFLLFSWFSLFSPLSCSLPLIGDCIDPGNEGAFS